MKYCINKQNRMMPESINRKLHVHYSVKTLILAIRQTSLPVFIFLLQIPISKQRVIILVMVMVLGQTAVDCGIHNLAWGRYNLRFER